MKVPDMKAVVRAVAAGLCVALMSPCSQAAVPAPARTITPASTIVSPANRHAGVLGINRLFASSASNSATWSSDGRSVFFNSDASGRMNIWRVPVGGAAAVQLSRSDERQSSIVATPDGRAIIFQSDHDGHQINDLYELRLGGSEAVNLTNTPDVDEASPVIAADGSLLAFSCREKNAESANVAVMDVAARKARVLTHEANSGLQWEVIAISRDDRFLIAIRHDYSVTVGEVYRIDLASGDQQLLTPKGYYSNASALSRDGRYVAVGITSAEGRLRPALIDVATSRTKFIPSGNWDERTGPFSPDGRYLILLGNVDAREIMSIYDVETGKAQALPFPPGLNSQRAFTVNLPKYSPDGRQLLFAHSSGSDPLEYWIYDLRSRLARPVTHLSSLAERSLPRSEVVHYRSADGTVISAVLWIPYNLRRDGTQAGLIMAHGGPTGEVMDQFDRSAAALASRGYFVLAPNFRGSTGYGKAFVDANRMDLGGGDLDDIIAGARFLVQTGYVSPKRLGIFGGSYGGYMTLMALAKTPDVFSAGVEEFGIVNWRTMWENGDPTNRLYQKGLVGDPSVNPDVYDKSSPLTYLHKVRAPLLVLQGENDPFVPAIEAHQVVTTLEKDGKVVDSHFYPREGHGFSKKEDQIDALDRIISWFDQYLKASSRPGTSSGPA